MLSVQLGQAYKKYGDKLFTKACSDRAKHNGLQQNSVIETSYKAENSYNEGG